MTTTLLAPPNTETRANLKHLYADIAWFGLVAGSVMAFLTIYAARLGATGVQIGLMAAGPAAINLLVSLPAGRWLENRPVIRTTFWSSIIHRLGYLALVPLPWLFTAELQIWSMIGITLLMSIPGALLAISFNAMYADIIPPERRAHVVGRRNMLIAISVTLTTLLCGQILDRAPFPVNYQIVFGIGVLGALASSYHLGKLRRSDETPPTRIWQPTGDMGRPGILRFIDALRSPPGLRFLTRSKGRSLFRLDLMRGPFGLFMAAYFLFYAFQYVPLPLFPLYLVQELDLSDSAISLGTALFYALMVMGSLRLSYMSARLGHRRVVIMGALLFSVYPLLLGLARDATIYWAASIIGGLVWAVLAGGLVNRLMERVPPDDRPAHMALHNLALNLGILVGSLLGPLLAEWLGLRDAILLSSFLRLGAGILLVFWA